MSTDDLAAIGWISIGAVGSAVLTLGVLSFDSVPAVPAAESAPSFQAPIYAPAQPLPVIDFAIIREEVETMVGPEGPDTGWDPPSVTPDARLPR